MNKRTALAKYIEAQNAYNSAHQEYTATLHRQEKNWRHFNDGSLQMLGRNVTRCWFALENARTNYVHTA